MKIKGTAVGAITDFDGNFSFKAQPGQTIEVSYIGYDTQTIVYRLGLRRAGVRALKKFR